MLWYMYDSLGQVHTTQALIPGLQSNQTLKELALGFYTVEYYDASFISSRRWLNGNTSLETLTICHSVSFNCLPAITHLLESTRLTKAKFTFRGDYFIVDKETYK